MNLPNTISLIRIALIPVMMLFFYLNIPFAPLYAAGIFLIAACTDFLDGHIARKRNLVTDFGKFLDPIADKVLVMAALILLVGWKAVTPSIYIEICAIIMLARELIIGGFRQVAASKNLVLAADKSGKVKTFVQDVAIIMAFLVELVTVYVYARVVIVVFVAATLLTIYSGTMYIVNNLNVLFPEPNEQDSE